MFYSKQTAGFYDAAAHGSRTITIVTPDWLPPTIYVPDPNWVAEDHPEEAAPMIEIDDPEAVPPTIEVSNPNCKLPPDAVEISHEQWVSLLEGQTQGKVIAGDANGMPVLQDPPPSAFLAPLSPRQIRMALTRAGLRAQVEAAVAAGDQDLKDWWEQSLSFERNHQRVEAMRVALNQTTETLDSLWALGATL